MNKSDSTLDDLLEQHVNAFHKQHLDTLQVAALLHCHPVSVPRFKHRHPSFPKPVKYKGKNWWKRTEIAAYIRNEFKKEGVT